MSQTIRTVLLVALCLGAATGAGCGSRRDDRPNVVLIVVDTLRADRTSAYGFARKTTPHLEALAKEGVLFENAWSQSSWTLPSMVSLFTGRYVLANYRTMPENTRSLAERLQASGYETAAIVANPLMHPASGFERGFDHYEVARHEKRKKTMRAPDVLRKAAPLLGGELKEPFFAWFQLYDPHDPYTPPASLRQVGEQPAPTPTLQEYRARQPAFAKRPVTEKDVRGLEQIKSYYDAEVAHADQAIGGIVRQLEQRGILENTLIIVTSDHGEGLFEHAAIFEAHDENELGLYRSHGNHVYEESVRIPFVVRGPGFPRGVRKEGPVENVDLYPTILIAAEIPPDPGAAGIDLRSLNDPDKQGKPIVFTFGPFAHAARSRAGWKIVQPARPQPKGERTTPYHLQSDETGRDPRLFNLTADPDERRDLRDAKPDRFGAIQKALFDWQEKHKHALGDGAAVSDETMRRLRELGYVR